MTNHPVQSFTRSTSARGFTVVELLVAISVLTLIVLVLYGLFDQVALLGLFGVTSYFSYESMRDPTNPSTVCGRRTISVSLRS